MSPESARPVRLAIVNDYQIVVAGLAAVLAEYGERVHVVEIDARLPVVSDVDLVLVDTFGRVEATDGGVAALARGTSAGVVVFSWQLPPERVHRALTDGAVGYVSKSATGAEIVAALERLRAGETVVMAEPSGVARAETGVGGWPGRAEGLSLREAEVLAFITQGLSNREIAERTELSINSVKSHIRSAYFKIGVRRRAQAVGWGMRHGFAPESVRVLDPVARAARGAGSPDR